MTGAHGPRGRSAAMKRAIAAQRNAPHGSNDTRRQGALRRQWNVTAAGFIQRGNARPIVVPEQRRLHDSATRCGHTGGPKNTRIFARQGPQPPAKAKKRHHATQRHTAPQSKETLHNERLRKAMERNRYDLWHPMPQQRHLQRSAPHRLHATEPACRISPDDRRSPCCPASGAGIPAP